MTEHQPHDDPVQPEQGLFKKYPKLSIIIIAVFSYGMLLAMCALVFVLLIRG